MSRTVLAWCVIAAVVAAACSSSAIDPVVVDSSSTTVPPTTTTVPLETTTTVPVTTTTTLRPIDADFVWANGARLVYRCAGDGPMSIIIENGLAGGADGNQPMPFNFMSWETVVDGVSDRARVCVYNRRGVGGSDNKREGVSLRTTQSQVDDLVVVIEELGLTTPLVIVGHSIAGLNIRLLADQHPDLVAGAVFVDASHPDQSIAMGLRGDSGGPVEYLDIGTSESQARGKGDMGDKPIVVLAAGKGPVGEPPETHEIWIDLQRDTATLSTNARFVLVEDAGHRLFGSHPEVVIEAILWVLDEVAAASG